MIRWLMVRDRPDEDLDVNLHPAERIEGRRYRHPGRYRQWLLGRTAAKRLLTSYGRELSLPSLTPADLWIHRTEAGWPEVRDRRGRPLGVALSIAHTSDRVLCAFRSEREGSVGVDLEQVAPRAPAFFEDFYTEGERVLLSSVGPPFRQCAATLMWTIKEAVLKARRTGLGEDAKAVEVEAIQLPPSKGWSTARIITADGCRPEVRWRLMDAERLALALVGLGATSRRGSTGSPRSPADSRWGRGPCDPS